VVSLQLTPTPVCTQVDSRRPILLRPPVYKCTCHGGTRLNFNSNDSRREVTCTLVYCFLGIDPVFPSSVFTGFRLSRIGPQKRADLWGCPPGGSGNREGRIPFRPDSLGVCFFFGYPSLPVPGAPRGAPPQIGHRAGSETQVWGYGRADRIVRACVRSWFLSTLLCIIGRENSITLYGSRFFATSFFEA
jgi:hypothetical protein